MISSTVRCFGSVVVTSCPVENETRLILSIAAEVNFEEVSWEIRLSADRVSQVMDSEFYFGALNLACILKECEDMSDDWTPKGLHEIRSTASYLRRLAIVRVKEPVLPCGFDAIRDIITTDC